MEVKVPDIGDFHDVPVIEILVQAGDQVNAEDPLITLESDKATMEVPSPAAGTVKEVKVKVGDKVQLGSLILLLDEVSEKAPNAAADASRSEAPTTSMATASASPITPSTAEAPAQSRSSTESGASGPAGRPASPSLKSVPASRSGSSATGRADFDCRMLVIGAGPGGYSATFRAADLGMSTILVERYPALGGVCLNVGCIPSKALLHAAKVIDEADEMGHFGIAFGEPKIDVDKLRGWKQSVVNKLTGGLASLAKQRKVQVVTGVAAFVDPHQVEVTKSDGNKQVIRFEQCIIAAGSQPIKLPFIPDDPRVVDSTGALELDGVPKNMLVIGGGIIGLEMAQVYLALGAKITVVEMLDQLMPGADADLVRPFAKRMEKQFKEIRLKTRVTRIEAEKKGLKVWFEGEKAPKEPELYNRVLVAVGRTPNGNNIAAEKAGITVDERGFIPADTQLRTNVPHIFAIGDIIGQPMLAHKAVHEAHVAAEAAAGEKAFFDARVIPSVAYTDPEVAWAGLTETQAKIDGIKYGKATFPWAASGRSLSLGRDEGMTKLLFDQATRRVIGGGIVGPNAGDLIAEVALAIEMGADAADIAKTIHPHPTLSETIGFAAEVFEGTITDLYVPKKK